MLDRAGIAYHEAGHAVVALAQSIEPGLDALDAERDNASGSV